MLNSNDNNERKSLNLAQVWYFYKTNNILLIMLLISFFFFQKIEIIILKFIVDYNLNYNFLFKKKN